MVNWSVNGAPGGNSAVGLISAAGFYTAPAVPPSGGTATVQAASTDSPSAIGTAIVTVTAPPAAPVLSSIAPNSGTQGTNVAVTLNGSNFQAGATVAIGGSGVSATGRHGGQRHADHRDLRDRRDRFYRRPQRHRHDERGKQCGPVFHSQRARAGQAHTDVAVAQRGDTRQHGHGYAHGNQLHHTGDGHGSGAAR